jgi:hypothetical protein
MRAAQSGIFDILPKRPCDAPIPPCAQKSYLVYLPRLATLMAVALLAAGCDDDVSPVSTANAARIEEP